MKKFISMLLIAIMLLSLQIFPAVYADEYSDLCQTLVSSYANGTKVDISRFGLNEESLDAAFVDLWYGGKLPWNAYSYSYSLTATGAIESFAPIYYDRAEYDYEQYEQAVENLIAQVIQEDMNQWEMALAVHDYLAVNSTYDETLQRNTNYDLLVNGTAVCTGYAMAYLDILTRLGIECRFVESQPMLHAWNMVKLDGQWYHVDVTHDDPTPDSYGYVSHDRFLKTDKEMEALGYYGWDNGISCTDETFTDPIWKNVNSAILFPDAASCYLRVKNEWEYAVEYVDLAQADAPQLLYTIPAQALTLEEDAYHYETNGLSLYDGRLWFSGADRVWSMLPDGTDVQTVFRYDIEKNKKFIYSSLVKDGILYLTLSDGEYQFSPEAVALEDTKEHTHDYKKEALEATCTQEGGITYLCACGLCYDGESIPALGHTYDSYISKPATCQQAGEKTFVCSLCDAFYTEDYSDPNAHFYAASTVKEASFFKEGTKYLTCQLCGYTTYENIPRLSFQKQFGLTIWSTLSVIALFISIPILIVSSRRRKNNNDKSGSN